MKRRGQYHTEFESIFIYRYLSKYFQLAPKEKPGPKLPGFVK